MSTQRGSPTTLLMRIIGFLLVIDILFSTGGSIVYAEETSDGKLNRIQNGSFELGQTWTDTYKQVNQNNVPNWNTTAKEGLIELLHENTDTYIKGVKVKPSDGKLAAELNADEESTLYQNIKTIPSSVYEWGIDHAARNAADTMALIIGPSQDNSPSKPSKDGRDQFMQMVDWLIEQGETSLKTEAGMYEKIVIYSKKFAENGEFVNNIGNDAFSLTPSTIYTEEWHIWIMASNNVTEGVNPWYSYGSNADNDSANKSRVGLDTDKYYLYTVPEGQTDTLFAFVSVGVYGSTVAPSKQKKHTETC